MVVSVVFQTKHKLLCSHPSSLAPEEWPRIMGKRDDSNAESSCLGCSLFNISASAYDSTMSTRNYRHSHLRRGLHLYGICCIDFPP
jgi:hypothetical protein